MTHFNRTFLVPMRSLLVLSLVLQSGWAWAKQGERSPTGLDLPYFEQNVGQAPPQIAYFTQRRGHAVGIGPEAMYLADATSTPIGLRFIGGRAVSFRTTALPGTINYLGARPVEIVGVKTSSRVSAVGIWPGVDLELYHDAQGRAEFDLVLESLRAATKVALELDGDAQLHPTPEGGLRIETPGGTFTIGAPYVLDAPAGKSNARLRLSGRKITLELEDSGSTGQVRVDPSIQYSSFLGDGAFNRILDVAQAPFGIADLGIYVVGTTESPIPFQLPQYFGGGFQPAFGGGTLDGFIAKLTADGSSLVYKTYFGGTSADWVSAVAVDGTGAAYIGGAVGAPPVPSAGAVKCTASSGGNDAFVAKVNPNGGSLAWIRCFGGLNEDATNDIVWTSSNRVYVAGYTRSGAGFPTTDGSVGSIAPDAWVAQFDSYGNLAFRTVFATDGEEVATTVASFGATGGIWVGGFTSKSGLTPIGSPFQPLYGGGASDGFLRKYADTTGAVLYSGYVGGSSGDSVNAILAIGNDLFVGGGTQSTGGLALGGGYKPFFAGVVDGFVLRLNSSGSAKLAGTYLGGTNGDFVTGLCSTTNGPLFVTGETKSTNFSTVNPVQSTLGGTQDIFVARLPYALNTATFSTYFGGGGTETNSNQLTYPHPEYAGTAGIFLSGGAIVTGGGSGSASLPAGTSPAYQGAPGGGTDGFVVKIIP